MMHQTYTYRMFKTGWGIYIELDASLLEGKTAPAAAVFENLWLDCSAITYLNRDEQQLLLEGARWAMAQCPPEAEQTIVLRRLYFNPCDYQKEGLFFALAHWLSQTFQFDLPLYTCFYDQASNRYIFPLLEE